MKLISEALENVKFLAEEDDKGEKLSLIHI